MHKVRAVHIGVVLLAFWTLSWGAPTARSGEAQGSYIFVSPTAGVWRWDDSGLTTGAFQDTWKPVFGVRGGYAPLRAIALEGMILRGSNDVEGAQPGTESLSATYFQVSGLVFFRGMGSKHVYPTLSLGLGYAWRSGGAVVDGIKVKESNNVTFQLGAGARAELNKILSLRLSVIDTFFNEKDEITKTDQVSSIVDMVEISLGLEFRLPMGRKSTGEKLR